MRQGGGSRKTWRRSKEERGGGRVPVKDIGNLALCLIPAGYLNSLCRNWRQRQGEGGRWKCLPIADSRNNGHIYGGVYYMWHRASRGAAKQNVKNQSPKSENKSQSRRAKVAGQNKRRPEKLSGTQKRQLEKGLEKSKLSERPAYLANTPEPGGTPSPTPPKMKQEEGRGKVLLRLRCSQVVVRRVWWAHQKDANVQYEGLAQHAGGMEESKELCQCGGSRTWARLGEKSSTKKGQEMKA